MGKYSIKELEKLSGIKAHTIRIWEKRHNIIAPARTQTNIRYYSDSDLKKIINVSLLNNNGLKISRIAEMSLEEIDQKVLEVSEVRNDMGVHIDQLVLAMIDLEEELFEKILGSLLLRYDFEQAIMQIVYPFLEKIGVLWQTRSITPAHEHFISNLIRQKIIVAIDGLPIPSKTARKIILFLPPGEMHEMGLLFNHYVTRKAGHRTYYLGQNVPHDDLISVCQTHQPDLMITSIISPMVSIERYLQQIQRDFPSIAVLASGMQMMRYEGQKMGNIQPFSSTEELMKFI